MLIKPRWRKILRDLWLNRTRTILVVLSIAVGVFAVGTITTTRVVLSTQLNEAYRAINPASATILVSGSFSRDVVEAVENMTEVEAAEARRMVNVRVKIGPDQWQLLQLNAIDDFEDIDVDKIWPVDGQWPPDDQEILIEESALGLIQAEVGETITIKDSTGKIRQVTVAGMASDLYAKFYTMGGIAYGYITFDMLEWLNEPQEFNDLRFTVADQKLNREHISDVAKEVQDKIEESGSTVWFTFIPVPGEHPMNFIIEPMLALLGMLSGLALVLSVFLVINMISALLTQQQQQIGVMKAIGATTRQIMSLYYIGVLIFGGLSLLIALPLGIIGANMLARGLAAMLNFNIQQFDIPPETMLLQVGIALVVPILAATYPIMMGTRITVYEAISGYGLGRGKFGTNLIDKLLMKLHTSFLGRPTIISLRNTFRRKARLGLTMATLIMAGAIFITVFSVQSSLQNTLNALLEYYQYDVAVQLNRPYRVERVIEEVENVPGIANAEGWAFTNVRRVRPDGTESDNITTFGPPANTQLVKPTIVEGRWLLPEDHNAVVINSLVLNDEPDLKVGGTITIKYQNREHEWEIVGVALGGGIVATMFTNYEYLSTVLRKFNEIEWVFTQTTHHTPEFRKEVLNNVEQYLAEQNFRVGLGITVDQDVQNIETLFAVIVFLILVMAILLAVVGALGLMGTMSINVLERIREIGVMRAIGASDWMVIQMVTIEGVLIGLLSWGMAVLLALPISQMISNLIGQQFLGTELGYSFSIGGAAGWLLLVVVLSAIASFLPAWNASRLTVREVLAYE